MDELTFTEKKLLKEYFEMESGYFLNMADEEFLQLFKQFGVDIDNTKYTTNGEYQIDRFCSCLEIEDKNTVLKILKEAYQYKKHFGFTEINLLAEKEMTILMDRLSGERKEIQTHTTKANSSVKPFLAGNQRLMSELSNEELTKIIVKAYGALVWKNAPVTTEGKKTKICDIERSKNFKDLLEILTRQHGIDLLKKSDEIDVKSGKKIDVNRTLAYDSLSAVNPFPPKKKKTP